MSGVKGSIEFDTGPVSDLLARLREGGTDLHEPLDKIGAVLEASTTTRFDTGTAPDGTPWKESLRVKLFGGQTLVQTARLKKSFTHQVIGNAVEWGTNVIYAAIHQFGGTIVPKTAKRLVFGALEAEEDDWGEIKGLIFAKKVVLPARPFIGVNDEDYVSIREVIVAFIRSLATGTPDVTPAGGAA